MEKHLRNFILSSCGREFQSLRAEWREMTEQIDWQAKQPSWVTYVSIDLKYLGIFDGSVYSLDCLDGWGDMRDDSAEIRQ